MEFRKNISMFYQVQTISLILVVLSLFLYILHHTLFTFTLLVLCFLILILHPMINDEYILIDEQSISCYRKKRQMWSFCWSVIESLRYSRRYRHPTIEIVLKAETVLIGNGKKRSSGYFFQVNRKIKQAIISYFPYKTEDSSMS